jgi:hypothetical protein
MPPRLTPDDFRQSLTEHVALKGAELRAKYGPRIGWNELLQILADRAFVRYPCELVFGAGPLQPGEFAHPQPKGARPEDGFTMFVHPRFAAQLDRVPYLVLYQLVVVNYGGFASPDDAEAFGASALGLSKDEYYRTVCALADELVETQAAQAGSSCSVIGRTHLADMTSNELTGFSAREQQTQPNSRWPS